MQEQAQRQAVPDKQPPATAKPQPKKKQRLNSAERNGAKKLMVVVGAGFLFYLLLLLIIALLLWYSFSTLAKSETLYAVRYYTEAEIKRAEERKKTPEAFLSYSVDQANNSYGLYLRYSDLSELFGFGIAGDETQISLFPPGSQNQSSITCYRDSSLVQINGTSVRLSAPILFEEDEYLIPLSLFESYLQGLPIQYDESRRICMITVLEEPTFTLKLQKPTPVSPVDPSELPSRPEIPEHPSSEPNT